MAVLPVRGEQEGWDGGVEPALLAGALAGVRAGDPCAVARATERGVEREAVVRWLARTTYGNDSDPADVLWLLIQQIARGEHRCH